MNLEIEKQNEIYYQHKYLKYKFKYLALKEEYEADGGDLSMKYFNKKKEELKDAKELINTKFTSIKEKAKIIANNKASAVGKKIQDTKNKISNSTKVYEIKSTLIDAIRSLPKKSELINTPKDEKWFESGFYNKIIHIFEEYYKYDYNLNSLTDLKKMLDAVLEIAYKKKYINSRSKLREYLLNAVKNYYK
jgi:hypothetical protein